MIELPMCFERSRRTAFFVFLLTAAAAAPARAQSHSGVILLPLPAEAIAPEVLPIDRPAAYLLSPEHAAVADALVRQGISVEVLREDVELDVEALRVRRIERFRMATRSLTPSPSGRGPGRGRSWIRESSASSARGLNSHQFSHVSVPPMLIETVVQARAQRFPAGTLVVPAEGPQGDVAAYLLEPHSTHGLAAGDAFGDDMIEAADYPVCRLPLPAPLLTAEYADLQGATAGLSRRASSEADASEDEDSSSKLPITFETLYGRDGVRFSGDVASGMQWLPDGQHYTQRKDGRLWKVHAATGRAEPAPRDPDVIADALSELSGIDSRDARRLAQNALRSANEQHRAAVVTHRGDLYYVTLDGSEAKRLTDSAVEDELATFSPDGRQVAFVRQFDLYVVDVETGRERRLTEDGSSLVRHGQADWVYYEEVYSRNWQAYHFSPDSRYLAFMEFDDRPVEEFRVINHLTRPEQEVESTRYPLAGRPNPRARLGIVPVAGGPVQWIDLAAYTPDDMLLVHYVFAPDSQSLYYYVQDRTQQWLDVNRWDIEPGTATKLFREETPAWVDNPGDPHFLGDGSFLLSSERDGWRHLYRFEADGTLLGRITRGEWEMRQVHHVTEEDGWIYFSGTRDSPIAENLYRVRLDGSGLARLTPSAGDHRTSVSTDGGMFLDTYSDYCQPSQVHLRRCDGSLVRVVDTNPVPELSRYRFGRMELVRIPNRDGFVMRGSVILPPDFDPQKKYPVWLQTYGGPHAPSLTDSWHGGRTFEHLLANLGIIAFRVDPRSASGQGAQSTWKSYRQLGVNELKDLEDALDWLAKRDYVDTDRIGVSGHSYGGFLTAFALTHSKRFAAGIAGAPVTDWHNYDTIYTERYMSTPQDNPEGYKETSVVEAAGELHGRLLLIHGARDDNVHLANTLQLANALQRADKQFEMMIYPPARHGIGGMHYQRLMLDFIRRTMLGDP
ncbi:MAG: S9 family peptidase [Pirellulales bacterium]